MIKKDCRVLIKILILFICFILAPAVGGTGALAAAGGIFAANGMCPPGHCLVSVRII